jgi:hypothetical protein
MDSSPTALTGAPACELMIAATTCATPSAMSAVTIPRITPSQVPRLDRDLRLWPCLDGGGLLGSSVTPSIRIRTRDWIGGRGQNPESEQPS